MGLCRQMLRRDDAIEAMNQETCETRYKYFEHGMKKRRPQEKHKCGTILATIFEEQSEKWELLVLSHTSNVIALVHDYIFQLLSELTDAYRKATTHARFLLAVERGGTPSTYNHYFNANLQKKRGNRMAQTFKQIAISSPYGNETEQYVPLSQIGRSAIDKDNGQQDLVNLHRWLPSLKDIQVAENDWKLKTARIGGKARPQSKAA
ncbi:hypothetical protein F5883DRAFT_528445 [Diaporthe sp. PMI_573]|nr:hypothetical protein F5883DRAFT_528445 [Diaporthaceae sp. PMI_573]